MTHPLITQDHIDTYQKDGVVLVKGLFKDFIEPLRSGIATNMAEPGDFGKQANLKKVQQVYFLMITAIGIAYRILRM